MGAGSGAFALLTCGTISSALFAAGGVRPIGSLRNILLKRRGTIVRRLDLYDMLIRGDTSDDARLLPDDVVFIPAIGPTVSVDGEVHRPAIYELRRETSVAEVIQLAGGLTPEADKEKLALTRIDDNLHRVVLQVDPSLEECARVCHSWPCRASAASSSRSARTPPFRGLF